MPSVIKLQDVSKPFGATRSSAVKSVRGAHLLLGVSGDILNHVHCASDQTQMTAVLLRALTSSFIITVRLYLNLQGGGGRKSVFTSL